MRTRPKRSTEPTIPIIAPTLIELAYLLHGRKVEEGSYMTLCPCDDCKGPLSITSGEGENVVDNHKSDYEEGKKVVDRHMSDYGRGKLTLEQLSSKLEKFIGTKVTIENVVDSYIIDCINGKLTRDQLISKLNQVSILLEKKTELLISNYRKGKHTLEYLSSALTELCEEKLIQFKSFEAKS